MFYNIGTCISSVPRPQLKFVWSGWGWGWGLQYRSIGFSFEFVPKRWKATTWTNMNQYQRHQKASLSHNGLTHWGRVTHICVSELTIIGSDNGLSSGRRQAIIWTNAEILLIGPSGTNFSEILIEILTFSFKKMRLKVSSANWRSFCLGLNVLNSFDGCVPVLQIYEPEGCYHGES